MAAAQRRAPLARSLVVIGVVLACGFGLVVRKTFRGASLEADVTSAATLAREPEPTVAPVSFPTPAPPTAHDFEKGRALLERGDAQGALRALTPIAQAEPDSAPVAYTYGKALWAAGSRDRAIMQLERAARIDPYAPAYRVDLAQALAAVRRTREAIREYEAAVSLDPGNADNVTALAALYARAGDVAESQALLRRAAMLKPGDAEIARQLAALDATAPPTSYTPSAISASSTVSVPSAVAASAAAVSASPPAPTGLVYTNDDLRRAGGGRTPGAVPPRPPPPIVRVSTHLGEDESHWREKAADRREELRSAEQRVAALRAQFEQLRRYAGGRITADDDLEREMAKAQDELDAAQERLTRAQRRMEDLQDEARRKGLPADWLR